MPEVQLSSRSRRQTSRDGRSSRQFGSVPFALTFHHAVTLPRVNRHYVISFLLYLRWCRWRFALYIDHRADIHLSPGYLMAAVLVLDEEVDVLPDDQFLQMSVAAS